MKATASETLLNLASFPGDDFCFTAGVIDNANDFPGVRDIFFALVRACEDCRDYANGDAQHRDNLAREMYEKTCHIYASPARCAEIALAYANATNPVL